MQRNFNMIIDRGCLERGCACYDERDGDGVEIIKREWVGLTEDEVESWRGNYDFFDSALVREVEAKLKEKNT